MKGSKRKLAAAAVVVLVITSGIHCFDQDASPVKTASLSEEQSGADNIRTPQLVPLNIRLPKPTFATWADYIHVRNLEKPSGRPRSPFL